MVVTAEKEKVIHKARGGRFPGELSTYCSGTKDGAYYWGPHSSDERLQKLLFFVNLGLEDPRKLQNWGDVASSSTSRALAELSTFAEGVVPNLPQLLQATADQVLNAETISLYDAEHVIATYKYLLKHESQGVTQEQYQAFTATIVKECQDQAQKFEDTVVPGAKHTFRLDDFCRQSGYIEELVGKIETANGENLTRWKSRISAQNSLNLIDNQRSRYESSQSRKSAVDCYHGVVNLFNFSSGSYVMNGRIKFSSYSSPLLPAEQDQVQGAFSEFREEMWRAAHPVKATLSDIFSMYRADLAETRAVLGRIGRKIGLLPTPEAK